MSCVNFLVQSKPQTAQPFLKAISQILRVQGHDPHPSIVQPDDQMPFFRGQRQRRNRCFKGRQPLWQQLRRRFHAAVDAAHHRQRSPNVPHDHQPSLTAMREREKNIENKRKQTKINASIIRVISCSAISCSAMSCTFNGNVQWKRSKKRSNKKFSSSLLTALSLP